MLKHVVPWLLLGCALLSAGDQGENREVYLVNYNGELLRLVNR